MRRAVTEDRSTGPAQVTMTDRAGMPGNLAVGAVQGDGAPDHVGKGQVICPGPQPGEVRVFSPLGTPKPEQRVTRPSQGDVAVADRFAMSPSAARSRCPRGDVEGDVGRDNRAP